MKECRKCKQLLDESEFSVVRTSNEGKKFYRPDCKACMRKTPNNNKPIEQVIKPQIKPPNKPNIDTLTNDEVKKVRELIKHTEFTIVSEDRSNRIVRSFNIDQELFIRMKAFSDKNKISLSDSINLLLSKSLDLLTD